MLCKLVYIIIIWASVQGQAIASNRCDLISKLEHPSIASNEKFWTEYSELAGKNKLTDKNLEDLLQKHGAGNHPAAEVKATSKPTSSMEFSMTKKATKEARNLNVGLRKKFEEFMDVMRDPSGLKKLYENPGKWRVERLQAKKDSYTVRLNHDTRVEFQIEDNKIEILQINADDIHTI